MAGLGLTALGIGLSGGFGPCGPQNAGPFFVAIFGALLFVLGTLGLFVDLIVLVSRKLLRLARSHPTEPGSYR